MLSTDFRLACAVLLACSGVSAFADTPPASGPKANPQPWFKNDLPPGTGYAAGKDGKFVKCTPPAGMTATEEFRSKCKAFLQTLGKAAMVQAVEGERWILPSDYPAHAAANGERGNTVFRVLVGKDGLPKSCEIVTSSGYPDLDRAACAAVMQRARFIPARDPDGNVIASYYSRSVSWVGP